MIKEQIEGTGTEGDGFRDMHAINIFATTGDVYPVLDEYDIPSSYNIDTVVLLPVNLEKVFVYWEITDKILAEKLQDTALSDLVVKLYQVNLGAKKKDAEKEVYSLNVQERSGSRYISCQGLKPLAASIGVMKNSVFVELAKSKPVSIPSFEVLGPDEDLWMQGIRDLPFGDRIKKRDPEVEQQVAEQVVTKPDDIEREMEILKQFISVRSKDTEILEIFVALLEQMKYANKDDARMGELLRRFVEVRSKDIELLRLFLAFIEHLTTMGGTGVDILDYFRQLKARTTETGSSSELLLK